MNVSRFTSVVLAITFLAAPAIAQEEKEKQSKSKSEKNVLTTNTYRVSVLNNLKVRNPQGDELGDIKDVVVDLQTQKVKYVAISVGGFLGIGEKLVAAPIDALKLVHGQEDNYFVLDADKQQLEKAPGFDEENWPDVADPRWAAEVDKSFGNIKTLTATVTESTKEKLGLEMKKGQVQDLKVGPKTVVMIDGEKADLEDLQKGQKVKIQTVEEEGARVARTIEAKTTKEKKDKQKDKEEAKPEDESKE